MNSETQKTLQALKNNEIDPEYVQDLVDGKILTEDEKTQIMEDYIFWLELNADTEINQIEKTLGKDSTDPIEKNPKVFTWGSSMIDENFDPLQEHHHVIIAGNRGGGKTTWSFFVASENAKLGRKVLYVSLEMKTQEIVTSSCRKAASISKQQWRERSTITEAQKERYYDRKKELEGLENLEMLGASNSDDSDLENILKVITAKNPDMVFIDNLDLIRTNSSKDNERQEQVSRAFMDYTNQNNIPIIMLHHINKAGDIRGNKKIEDNADLIILCARNEDGTDPEQQAEFKAKITKSRDWGEFVTQTLYFDKGHFKDRWRDMPVGFM